MLDDRVGKEVRRIVACGSGDVSGLKLRGSDPPKQGLGITTMFVERRSSAWRSIDVEVDAWRREDTIWDRDVLFALLETAGSNAAPFSSAKTLVRRIVPSARLRSAETVGVSVQGSLRRGSTESPDVELLAWAVGCIWGQDTVTSALAQGIPMARYRGTDGSTSVHVCLPISHVSAPLEVVAVSLEATDAEDAIQWVSRLTLVRHLWSTAHPESAAAADDLDFADDVTDDDVVVLTPRQHVILKAMSLGRTNSQIARSIGFSESTVRVESMAIYRYFGVHSRLEAVEAARLTGELLAPEDIPHG
jgi:DNA-binding CsgD family transcriptional regulator